MDAMAMLMQQTMQTLGVPAQAAPQSKPRANGETGNSFEALVRQKRQDVVEEESPVTGKPVRQQPTEETGEEEPRDEQLAMAVGLMMEVRPEIQYVETAPEVRAQVQVQTQPQTQPVESAPVTAQPVEAAPAAEAAPEMAAAQETILPETAEAPAPETAETVETVERPAETTKTAELPREQRPVETRNEAEPVETRTVERHEAVRPVEESEEEEAPRNEIGQETPLFREPQAVPVKVAEPAREPVELEAPEGTEKLAKQVNAAIEIGQDRVEITLAPESLGKLTIQITRSETGMISVLVNAANPRTAALIERHMGGLQNLLASATRTEVRVEVQNAGETPKHFLNPDGDENAREQQRQRHQEPEKKKHSDVDFLQKLRLGLTSLDGIAS